MYNTLSKNTWSTSHLQPFNLSYSKLKGTTGCNTGHNDSCRQYFPSDLSKVNSDNKDEKYYYNMASVPGTDVCRSKSSFNGVSIDPKIFKEYTSLQS